MPDLLVLAAFLSFVVFLLTSRYRIPAALAGWCCIVLNLWLELPAFLSEDNFLYPFLALLALPFLLITMDRLLHDDPIILRLSRTAAIATLIWVPFALVPFLGNGLIAFTVSFVFPIISTLGHHPQLFAWDVIAENGFYNQIVLSCTGILAVAVMIGLVFTEKVSTRQAVIAFLLVVPMLLILNLFRIAVVFIAVADRWFAAFPDPTGTGDANFFWAHNVIAEGLALGFLFLLLCLLTRFIPSLKMSMSEAISVYCAPLLRLVR